MTLKKSWSSRNPWSMGCEEMVWMLLSRRRHGYAFSNHSSGGVVEEPCQTLPLPHPPDQWNCCRCRSSYSNRLPTTATSVIATSIGIIISRICSHDCQHIVNFSLDNFGSIARILLLLRLNNCLFLLNNNGCSRCRWSRSVVVVVVVVVLRTFETSYS